MTELLTREFQIRAVDEEGRTVEGIAVPYETETDLGDYVEKFQRGAFGDIEDVKLFYGHSEPIGRVIEGEDREDGFYIKATISDTPKGNEVRTLLKDGVLNKFSVGFLPTQDRVEKNGVLTRVKAVLKEVSVVAFPAYAGATVLAVREDSSIATNTTNERTVTNETVAASETNMSEIEYASVADLDDVRGRVDVLSKAVADAPATEVKNASQFRTAGQLVFAHANGDATAQAEMRDFAVTTDSHVGDGWLGGTLKVIDRGRPLVNLFSKGALPAQGMTVTYPYLSGITGDVNSAAEGVDLAYMEVVVDTRNAPVIKYGAYSKLSREVVTRSDVSYLDAVLRAQAASYAKKTNAVVRTLLTGASAQAGTSFTLSSADVDDVLGAVVDAVSKIDANAEGEQAEFIVVSGDVWAKVVGVAANGFALDFRGDGGNTLGTADVRGMAGTLLGLPVVVDGSLPAKSFYVTAAAAISTWENGAPVRLDDQNVVDLTQVYSIHGLMAAAVTNELAIVKAVIA